MFYNLRTRFKGKIYSFISPLGWLLSKNDHDGKSPSNKYHSHLPTKANDTLAIVAEPYSIRISNRQVDGIVKITWLIKFYALLLIWLQRHCYPGLWLLSHLRLKVFDDSEQAISAFCKIHPADQKVLCLPRSVFAATLSKRFKHHGVMIIGAFLPSRHLHAYIIEDSRNPCWFDTAWINYTPIVIMS